MSKSCKTSMKEDYQKAEFWLNPKNHYWETDMYTEEGKKYLREFVKNIKKEGHLKNGRNFERSYT